MNTDFNDVIIPVGSVAGKHIADIPTAKLLQIRDWYARRDFSMWRAANSALRWRACEAWGLLALSRAELEAYDGEHQDAAEWLLSIY